MDISQVDGEQNLNSDFGPAQANDGQTNLSLAPKALPSSFRPHFHKGLRPLLHAPAAKGDLAMISEMLDDDVPVDMRSPNGSTALMTAVKYGQTDAAKLLLAHGATSIIESLEIARANGQAELEQLLTQYLNKQEGSITQPA